MLNEGYDAIYTTVLVRGLDSGIYCIYCVYNTYVLVCTVLYLCEYVLYSILQERMMRTPFLV